MEIKKRFQHDILKLIEAVKNIYKIKRLNPALENELRKMLTPKPWIGLRYDGVMDDFGDANDFDTEIVYKKVMQVINLIEDRFT